VVETLASDLQAEFPGIGGISAANLWRMRHQIENRSYEKTMLGQTNVEETLPEEIRGQATLANRDEYTFDLLELGDEHSERQLETAILGRIEPFLREMGGEFSFIVPRPKVLCSILHLCREDHTSGRWFA
jgi:predicted nuclease of restriction endonuclease-like (RecB) superfamily